MKIEGKGESARVGREQKGRGREEFGPSQCWKHIDARGKLTLLTFLFQNIIRLIRHIHHNIKYIHQFLFISDN